MTKLTITQKGEWNEAYVGEIKIGGFGKTSYTAEDMRWYWTANGSFGHCASRTEALIAIQKTVPVFLAAKAKEKADQMAAAALPAHLQELKAEMDTAYAEQQMAWGRSSFNVADYRSASDRWYAAKLAFDLAHDAWQSKVAA